MALVDKAGFPAEMMDSPPTMRRFHHLTTSSCSTTGVAGSHSGCWASLVITTSHEAPRAWEMPRGPKSTRLARRAACSALEWSGRSDAFSMCHKILFISTRFYNICLYNSINSISVHLCISFLCTVSKYDIHIIPCL